jgi:hypothetical protein
MEDRQRPVDAAPTGDVGKAARGFRMERCLLVGLIAFPFAVLFVSAGPLLPGTTATFFLALAVYGVWLALQRGRERRDASTRTAAGPQE